MAKARACRAAVLSYLHVLLGAAIDGLTIRQLRRALVTLVNQGAAATARAAASPRGAASVGQAQRCAAVIKPLYRAPRRRIGVDAGARRIAGAGTNPVAGQATVLTRQRTMSAAPGPVRRTTRWSPVSVAGVDLSRSRWAQDDEARPVPTRRRRRTREPARRTAGLWSVHPRRCGCRAVVPQPIFAERTGALGKVMPSPSRLLVAVDRIEISLTSSLSYGRAAR